MIDRTQTAVHRRYCPLLFLASVLCAASAFSTEPTAGPLAGTTAAHNLLRQNLNNQFPPVPNAAIQPKPLPALPNFIWDDTVAASAQAWADGCSLGHDPSKPYGENLALAGTGYGLTGPGSALLWADEVRIGPGPGNPPINPDPSGPYDYATHQCPAWSGSPAFPNCGHYTAMAWSSTARVGCGYKVCGGTEWLVCRYDPAGNVNVQTTRPYCTATQVTNCRPGPVCAQPDDWHKHLASQTVATLATVHVCQTITTGVAYTVSAAGNVTLRGPLYVAFDNGLSVLANGTLTVWNN